MLNIESIITLYNEYKNTIKNNSFMDITLLDNFISVQEQEELKELNNTYMDIFNKDINKEDYYNKIANIIKKVYEQLNFTILYNNNIIELLNKIITLYDNEILKNMNIKYNLNDKKYLYSPGMHQHIKKLEQINKIFTDINSNEKFKNNFDILNTYLKHIENNNVHNVKEPFFYTKFDTTVKILNNIENRYYPVRVKDLYNKIDYITSTSKDTLTTFLNDIKTQLKSTENFTNSIINSSLTISDQNASNYLFIDVDNLIYMDNIVKNLFRAINKSDVFKDLSILHREIKHSIDYFLNLTKVNKL